MNADRWCSGCGNAPYEDEPGSWYGHDEDCDRMGEPGDVMPDEVLTARRAEIERLIEAYPTDGALRNLDAETVSDELFVLVQSIEGHGDYWLGTFTTFDEAALYAGGEILDGWGPEAIYNLDTGERIELHVSSPIVTRAEDQDVMVDPRPEPASAAPQLKGAERERLFAQALLDLFQDEGWTCAHGVGLDDDCPGEAPVGRNRDVSECFWQPARPALREAVELLGGRSNA